MAVSVIIGRQESNVLRHGTPMETLGSAICDPSLSQLLSESSLIHILVQLP